MMVATTQVKNIKATLKMPVVSPSPMALLNGLNKAKMSKKVNKTTMCTTILLPFLNIGDNNKNNKPKEGAIKAVGDWVTKYPHKPIANKTKPVIIFIEEGVIMYDFVFNFQFNAARYTANF